MSDWAPRPRRPMGTDPGGIFEYDEAPVVIKSQTPMQRQREMDGTPMTRSAHSSLRPAGPKLTLGDFEEVNKSVQTSHDRAESMYKSYEKAVEIVKSFLSS